MRLLIRRPTALTATEQKALQTLCQMHPRVDALYQLTQGFMSMLYEHQAAELPLWLAAARRSGIAELESFAQGVEQDKAAVSAGPTLPYSNGVVEGHVNRGIR